MCVLPGSGFQGSNGFTAVFSIIYRGFLKSWGISKPFQVTLLLSHGHPWLGYPDKSRTPSFPGSGTKVAFPGRAIWKKPIVFQPEYPKNRSFSAGPKKSELFASHGGLNLNTWERIWKYLIALLVRNKNLQCFDPEISGATTPGAHFLRCSAKRNSGLKKNTVGWWFYPKKYESSQPLIPSLAKQQ